VAVEYNDQHDPAKAAAESVPIDRAAVATDLVVVAVGLVPTDPAVAVIDRAEEVIVQTGRIVPAKVAAANRIDPATDFPIVRMIDRIGLVRVAAVSSGGRVKTATGPIIAPTVSTIGTSGTTGEAIIAATSTTTGATTGIDMATGTRATGGIATRIGRGDMGTTSTTGAGPPGRP
jgi:hypothetical protein